MSKHSNRNNKQFKVAGAFGKPIWTRPTKLIPKLPPIVASWSDKLKFCLVILKIRILAFIRRMFKWAFW